MASDAIYKRPAFPNRPWITGKVYDDYKRPSILHLDAYTFAFGGNSYLVMDWREGGFKAVALDGYLIEPDGLTPVWDIDRLRAGGRVEYWTRENHATMRGVHQAVLAQQARMLALGRGQWARVVVQAHYVNARDADHEIRANAYREPKAYAPRMVRNNLPDIL